MYINHSKLNKYPLSPDQYFFLAAVKNKAVDYLQQFPKAYYDRFEELSLVKYIKGKGEVFERVRIDKKGENVLKDISTSGDKNSNKMQKAKVGDKYKTNEGYEVEVIRYNKKTDVDIKFTCTGFTLRNRHIQNIREGAVRNPFHTSVQGIGYLGEGNKGKYHIAYKAWNDMLIRCYNPKYQAKQPTYIGCNVVEEWHNFQNFAAWFEENYVEGWELDKDVICPDCKIYSPETCAFVPREINAMFTKRKSSNKSLPKGVTYHWDKQRYRARLNNKGEVRLGIFNTPEEAFQAYKIPKEQHIQETAEKWKDKIDPRVYQAMMNYEVKITD